MNNIDDDILNQIITSKVSNVRNTKADSQKNRLELIKAIEKRNINTIINLIDNIELNPNFLIERASYFHSPLSFAVSLGHDDIVDLLLERNASQSLSENTYFEETKQKATNTLNPSYDAAYKNNFTVALKIIEKELASNDKNAQNNAHSCVELAANHYIDVFKTFVDKNI